MEHDLRVVERCSIKISASCQRFNFEAKRIGDKKSFSNLSRSLVVNKV